MDEETLLRVRTLPRLCPSAQYARHTPGIAAPLPCTEADCDRLDSHTARRHASATVMAAPNTTGGSSVRILAILCSKKPNTPTSTDSAEAPAAGTAAEMELSRHQRSTHAPVRSPAANDALPLPTAPSTRKRGRSAGESSSPDEGEACALRPEGRRRREDKSENALSCSGRAAGCAPSSSAPVACGSVYLRVMYDEVLIETLPLELFREKHPQILIDYLLSVGCWV